MTDELRVQGGGSGEPVLLLLHGMGATGDVWNGWWPLLEREWPGRWLAPDLPGHGGSATVDGYSFRSLAAGVARVLDPGAPLVILGHSLGGVLGLELAGAAFELPVRAVVGVGVKVVWTGAELDRMAALAGRPVARFRSRDEAATRYLRVSGLDGLLAPDAPQVDAGLRSDSDGWRLAMDPGVFGVGAPDMPALLAGCGAPVRLARGEHDAMVSGGQLAALDPAAVTLAGLGHNAHVDDPAAVFALLRPYLPTESPH